MNSKKIALWFARLISLVFQPIFVIGIFMAILVIYFAPDFRTGLIRLLITAFLIGLIPITYTIIAARFGWIKNAWLERRQDRIGPFLVAAFCMIINLMIFYKFGVDQEVLVFMMALILVLTLTLIITLFWKISVHTTVITIVAVAANVISDGALWYLFLLIPLVMWARVYKKNHTILQALVGCVLNGVIVYMTFKIFGY